MKTLCLMIATLLPMPAMADVRATYGSSTPGVLTVEVDDSGAARASMTGHDVELIQSPTGQQFIVATADGKPNVMRVSDIMAMLKARNAARPVRSFSGERGKFVASGASVVSGFNGQVFKYQSAREPTPQAKGAVVISDDPKLAPVGRFVASLLSSLMTATGADALEPNAQLVDLLKSGTLIDLHGVTTLLTVETADLPPARFVLPAEPLSPEAVRMLAPRLFATPRPKGLTSSTKLPSPH